MTELAGAVPALPVRDVPAAADHYRDRLGFEPVHVTHDYTVVVRDSVHVHLWGAIDDAWRSRADLADRPISSGAESFLSGTASCRIEVRDVDALFAELEPKGVLHDVSRDGVEATDRHARQRRDLGAVNRNSSGKEHLGPAGEAGARPPRGRAG